MGNILKPSKEILYDLYINQNMERQEIANLFNCSIYMIKSWLQEYNLTNHPQKIKTSKKLRKGYNQITGSYISAIKSRNQEYNLSLEYLWDLYIKQNKKCIYSGIEIVFPPTSRIKDRNKQTASLDRINSSFGYIYGNVQWIHKDLQSMKSNMDEYTFLKWIKTIASYRGL